MSVLTDMSPREVALYAWAKYRVYQDRCSNIEERALDRFGGVETVTKQRLAKATEYWKYRELCGTRNYWQQEAQLASAVALLERENA